MATSFSRSRSRSSSTWRRSTLRKACSPAGFEHGRRSPDGSSSPRPSWNSRSGESCDTLRSTHPRSGSRRRYRSPVRTSSTWRRSWRSTCCSTTCLACAGSWSGCTSARTPHRGLRRRSRAYVDDDPRRSVTPRSAERLAVMHASVHDLEAESLVCALGRLVVDPRVRGDLRAALRTRPVLGCADEGPTDPATSMLRLDVPALDEAHWLAPVAAVRMGAESDLDQAYDLPVHLGHEDYERHRAWRAACQDRACLLLMLGE